MRTLYTQCEVCRKDIQTPEKTVRRFCSKECRHKRHNKNK